MKRSEIKKLINSNGIDMCCIQESKLEQVSSRVGNELWPNSDFEWVWKEAEGRAGGLISIWNKNLFTKTSSWHCRGLLVVNGRWREDGGEMVIMNVYAPSALSEKEQLWDLIKMVIQQNVEARVCVVGDFNSIRTADERIGRREEPDRRDINLFVDFISSSGLVDIPLRGRKFTWYKPDGTCKSKLDRIMVNDDWLEWKPDLILKSLGRSFSDHCLIFLKSSIKDWVLNHLNSLMVGLLIRISGIFASENGEAISWSREHFGDIRAKMEEQKEIIEKLDRFDEIFGLEKEEIIERNRVEAKLRRNMIWNESFLC
ncbi:hypothetical protein ACS0TY_026433 [Phlomoides rotata]